VAPAGGNLCQVAAAGGYFCQEVAAAGGYLCQVAAASGNLCQNVAAAGGNLCQVAAAGGNICQVSAAGGNICQDVGAAGGNLCQLAEPGKILRWWRRWGWIGASGEGRRGRVVDSLAFYQIHPGWSFDFSFLNVAIRLFLFRGKHQIQLWNFLYIVFLFVKNFFSDPTAISSGSAQEF
jgi:hypothetical protein